MAHHDVGHENMKSIFPLIIGFTWALSGCVTYDPKPDKKFLAPATSLDAIVTASTEYRSRHSRWPEDIGQLREGYLIANIDQNSLAEITEIQIAKNSDFSSTYVIKYSGGGSSTIELNAQNKK